MSDILPPLIRAVEQADSAQRLLQAVHQLADTRHEGAIPTLITVLGYNNPGAAVAAVDGLVSIGEPSVPALLEQLDQHNYTARSWAIRALAGIGDPRSLVTLLGAATADFSLSVRRAATRGLGAMKWCWFPEQLLPIAQEEAMEALLFVAQQDEEWVVRYAAIVGLQSLAIEVTATHPDWRLQMLAQFEQQMVQDEAWAVRARACMAWKAVQNPSFRSSSPPPCDRPDEATSPLSATDWQNILDKLYERKQQERAVFTEGDPRRYKDLAVAVAQPTVST